MVKIKKREKKINRLIQIKEQINKKCRVNKLINNKNKEKIQNLKQRITNKKKISKERMEKMEKTKNLNKKNQKNQKGN